MIKWTSVYYGEIGCASSGNIYEISLCESTTNNVTNVFLILYLKNTTDIICEHLLTNHTNIETERIKNELKNIATIKERKNKIKNFLNKKERY